MQLCIEASKLINVIGLSFDIIGAWLVAIEVVKRYNGEKYKETDAPAGVAPVLPETDEFKAYEKSRYLYMKIGLLFLTVGFILQALSDFV